MAKYDKVKKSKSYRLLIAICSVTTLIIVIAIALHVKNENKIYNAQNGMSEYLKNKYNKDFEVGRPKLSGGGLDVLGAWEADAYPTDDKSMVFRIIKAENRDNFSDQYTAKIWSQRETARLNRIAQQNASSSKWKVTASVEIYLAEPLSDIALPDNPKMENIIKQDHGLSYTVGLSYEDLESDTSMDDMVNDANRITSVIRASNIHNLDINYSISTRYGKTKKCETTYDKPFDYSYDNIKNCLK